MEFFNHYKKEGLGQRRQRGTHRVCAGRSSFRLPTGEHLPAIPGRPGTTPRSPRRAGAAPPQALHLRHSGREGGVVAATSRDTITQHI